MINDTLLRAKIEEMGFDNSTISNDLGLSEQVFNKKLIGKSEFRVSHINRLRELLHLTNSEVGEIFFQQYSDKVMVNVEMLYEQLPLTVRLELLEQVRAFKAIGVKV